MKSLEIYNTHHYRSLWLFAVSCLNFCWTSSLCDYKVLCPQTQYFSICSCMSTEWLISSGRDKRLVSMATTYAPINMPAVCADKAWHYVLLSLSLSTHGQPWGLHKHRKCTWTEFGGKTLGGSAGSPMTLSQRCTKYEGFWFLAKQNHMSSAD